MKKSLATLMFILLALTGVFSLNPCFPGGITFSTQHDIDIYEELNPDCNEIIGDVIIEGNDIQNLGGLSIITLINGSLIIRNCPNLTNAAGLINLTTIGGNFEFVNNDSKINLFGFGALTSIGSDLIIQDNQLLSTLKGGIILQFTFPGLLNVSDIAGDIFIDSNPALDNPDGLAGVVSIDGDIKIYDNSALTSIEGLEGISENVHDIIIFQNNALVDLMGLHNISTISGLVRLENNQVLADCDGLAALNSLGDLMVWYNPMLQSLEGLSNLQFNSGVLSIQGNDVLQDLNGLNNLTEVGSIIIFNNPSLEEITDLWDLTTIAGGIFFEENNALTSLQGINNIDHTNITELTINNNALLSYCDVESICDFIDDGGPTFIAGNAAGCASYEEVDAACSPPKCPQLISPMDGDTDVDPFAELIWTSEDNPSGYILSIGTSPYGNELLDNENIQLTNSYAYEPGFPCGATIYVRIIAYNENGESLDCAEFDFTVETVSIVLISELEICPGDSVLLEPITDATYISWSPQTGLDDPFSFTPLASPETTTTYVATVSSTSQSCMAQSFVTVVVLENPGMDLYDFAGIICPNECTGIIAALGGGGTPPYTYLWSSGEDEEKIFDVCPGSHWVTVTDSKGCTDEQEMIVYEYPWIEIELDEIIHVTDSTMGSISLNAYYTSTIYTANIDEPFEWSGVNFEYSSNETSIDSLAPGCYQLVTFGGDESCSIDTVFCVENNTTGVFDTNAINSPINIYPNPTSSKLYIEFSSEKSVETDLVLYDISGRALKTFALSDKKSVIDISHYKPGLYFIRVIDGNRRYFKKVLLL